MLQYRVAYRPYVLSKAGIGLAYLWFVFDFLRIHLAAWEHPSLLLLNPAGMVFIGSSTLDPVLLELAELLNGTAAVWTFFALSPVAVGGYLWGRHRWLQFAVGSWMSFSMIALASLSGCFASTADLWLHLNVLAYVVAALVTPGDAWAESEPRFGRAQWERNPTFASVYASLVVWVQFSTYVFAGVNKLAFGWEPWTHGTALQNLAFDTSMRDFARGTPVPYALSLVLCYVTLLQRLVVPFGFFVPKWRMWSVLILGAMHVGYAILMNVNLFPVVGISSLLMVWPARDAAASEPLLVPRGLRELLQPAEGKRLQLLGTGVFVSWLLLEPIRLISFGPMAWENKLMVVPAWRMFADGGVAAGGAWRLMFATTHGDVDATDLSLEALPQLWRDRFVVDLIFHELATRHTGPNSLTRDLLLTAQDTYRTRQRERGDDEAIVRSGFEIYFKR